MFKHAHPRFSKSEYVIFKLQKHDFLNLRRTVHQDKLNELVIAGTNPAWQELLNMKIGFINHLAFTYGCTTSAPTVGNQARISQNPPPPRRRRLRGNQMQNINRNIYNK